jgi:hypothetical protein
MTSDPELRAIALQGIASLNLGNFGCDVLAALWGALFVKLMELMDKCNKGDTQACIMIVVVAFVMGSIEVAYINAGCGPFPPSGTTISTTSTSDVLPSASTSVVLPQASGCPCGQ